MSNVSMHDSNMAMDNSPPSSTTSSKLRMTSSEASMELWSRIQNNSSSEGNKHRFSRSQRNRTLEHPCLVQPTAENECVRRRDIASGRLKAEVHSSLQSAEEKKADEEADLKARLSAALSLAKPSTDSNGQADFQVDGYPSPTSTLHFPEPMMQHVAKDPFTTQCDNITLQGEAVDNYNTESPYVVYPEQVQTPVHPLPTSEMEPTSPSHTFVVCADTQIGMTSQNKEWETELEYCRECIKGINALHPRPKFACVCGDLVDMEYTFEEKKGDKSPFTRQECDEIQDQQNKDFQEVWSDVHEDIALVCLCGNHDIGNRPTAQSIQRFRDAFGDEYLSFWVNGTYNIVLNNVLFTNPTGAPEIFEEQLRWLEDRLRYASEHGATMIFVFGHHPWFLYHEEEDIEDFSGGSAFPTEWGESTQKFPDSYFSVPKKYRLMALDLFREYGVNAAFSGHFHQNLLSKTSWGMDMIVTGPLSMVFESDGKPAQDEINVRGMRIVTVEYSEHSGGEKIGRDARFSHRFVPL